jgi:hypothetical protein
MNALILQDELTHLIKLSHEADVKVYVDLGECYALVDDIDLHHNDEGELFIVISGVRK